MPEPNSLEELIHTKNELIKIGLFEEARALNRPIELKIIEEYKAFKEERLMQRGTYGFIN